MFFSEKYFRSRFVLIYKIGGFFLNLKNGGFVPLLKSAALSHLKSTFLSATIHFIVVIHRNCVKFEMPKIIDTHNTHRKIDSEKHNCCKTPYCLHGKVLNFLEKSFQKFDATPFAQQFRELRLTCNKFSKRSGTKTFRSIKGSPQIF